ncbi:Glycolate dehydrogenase subunit GlcD [Desulfurella amilsii]|uniref:Glycolate dehydrogenase subunit GlcD n=1 Tax=Desulfurella amilsii TaxID=1562698 RepID=A0A1X4XXB4_9BACT|nr:FAD-linked oxidase C-terminal domain-containing protein [Desulfurella amilsii]OSS42181.1 Glycolate dehydrogenase subunit GlcD [Desulfurella amilsii]
MQKVLIEAFEGMVGKQNCWSNIEDTMAYSYDAFPEEPKAPDIVVKPQNYEQISSIIKLCNENSIPLIVRGAGTNLSGGTLPVNGGCVMLMSGFNNILEINMDDLYAVVQAGVVTQKFADAVAKKGLLYPPDPASLKVSTLGGNVAENSGGLRALKYGVTSHYLMGVKFLDSEGNFIKGGGKPVKLVTGYNLPGLMLSSEGTLGVMVEFILKLVPPPQSRKSLLVIYSDLIKASQTVSDIISSKIVPATLEILDNFTIQTVEKFHHLGLPISAQAILLIEVDGHEAQVEDEYKKVADICKSFGGEVHIAKDDTERDSLWQARRDALSSLARLNPTLILEDATVPRSKVPAMMQAINDIAKKYNLLIGTFGHAGDGNLHPTILTDKRNVEEMKRVEKAIDEIFEITLKLEGTLSGEHGIGIAKAKYLESEVGKSTIAFMKRLKYGLDPNNILNPHKMSL